MGDVTKLGPRRRLFDTVVDGRLMEVWYRPDEHDYGKWNGCPPHWWLRYVSGDHVEWEPWIDKGNARPCWDVRITQGNRTKVKWAERRIRRFVDVTMLCNQRAAYWFSCGDLSFAFARAQALTVELNEHPFNFADAESEIGRKVWYRRQPAIVSDLRLDEGILVFRADGIDGFDMRDPWDDPDGFGTSEWHGEAEVHDDALARDIWWFR